MCPLLPLTFPVLPGLHGSFGIDQPIDVKQRPIKMPQRPIICLMQHNKGDLLPAEIINCPISSADVFKLCIKDPKLRVT